METNTTNTETEKSKKYSIEISDVQNDANEQSNTSTKTQGTEQTEQGEAGTQTQTVNANEEPKKKRGRPKGSKENKNENTNNNNDYSQYSEQALKDDINKSNPQPNANLNPAPNNTPPPVKIDVSKFITGALLLIVMDAVVPSLLLKGLSMFDSKYNNVDKRALKLEADERKALEPLASEVIKHIFMNINPVTAFFVCTTIIYGSKIIMLDEDDFKD